jgi:hypothetical protein
LIGPKIVSVISMINQQNKLQNIILLLLLKKSKSYSQTSKYTLGKIYGF